MVVSKSNPHLPNDNIDLVVVIPTYNEADNLANIVAELLALDLERLRILIVDDNSPDGTGQIADSLVALHPDCVHVIHRQGRAGLGLSYLDGFRQALRMGAEGIVQMDADFSHSPQYIPVLLAHLREADVVVGSRYVPGGSLDEHWGWWRHFLSWWANSIYTRVLLGLPVKDGTAGFKLWRRATLEGIDLDSIQSNGYVFQVEMAYVCKRLGYRVVEVPIHFEDRRIGRSKMSVPVKIEAALRTFEIRWRHRHLQPQDRRTLVAATR
ncbi:MAG: polyprenol monophosphomannose synthase [Caldilineales bacterium]|nr:polyprenol monophosphomannose synthase [Caldilineales bacterium]